MRREGRSTTELTEGLVDVVVDRAGGREAREEGTWERVGQRANRGFKPHEGPRLDPAPHEVRLNRPRLMVRPSANSQDQRTRRLSLSPLSTGRDGSDDRTTGQHRSHHQSRARRAVRVQRPKRNGSGNRSGDQQEKHEPGDQSRHRKLSLGAHSGTRRSSDSIHDTSKVNKVSTRSRAPLGPTRPDPNGEGRA